MNFFFDVIHSVDYIKVVEGDRIDAFLVLIQSVHTVRIEFKNLSYEQFHLLERVVEIHLAIFNYLQELLLGRVTEVDRLEPSFLPRL